MATYTHDVMFDALKRTKEQVVENYTSSQYLKTLDFFLWKALTPIIESCPSLFSNYVSKIVAQQSVRNSKMTSDEKANLPLAFINYLVAPTDQRIELAKKMYLNRGILFAFLALFLEITGKYRILAETPAPKTARKVSDRLLYMHNVEQQVGLQSGRNLYSIVLEVFHWTEEATNFKNVIIEKYTRMTLNNARRAYVDCQQQVPLGDIIGIFMLTLSKAIDRCDSRHGVLTTFIQNWFRGARSSVMDSVREEHTLTSYEARVEQAGDSLDDLGSVEPDTSLEAVQALAYVAKRADPRGCIRASLGIPELLSNRKIKTLELLMEKV